ncbi:MAG: UTP--glucose-1-phosphate uridylyltransferase [Coxiella sp. RIFCSPHIGHO2_12_FULL_42_15]|nr:MAG: UTP--glucose-1-phosphate uridylyltransferase [Coxiella sp. RIFCSPHIGHO2_12_FULL_42_15]
MAKSEITTAVFPVAGLGTRFLPITKTGPKEMLPIVDKPIIQYAVQEAVAAGITHLVFVTSSEKRSIEDYFDRNLQLEMWLEQHGKLQALQTIKNILPTNISISYVRQPMPLGLGHAILCAKHVVGDQPFAVLLPDDIIDCYPKTCMESMMACFHEKQASLIAVESVKPQDVNKYGIVELRAHDPEHQIVGMVEKPPIGQAPSLLAVIGRYILMPRIFSLLMHTPTGANGEIQLTDAVVEMLKQEKAYAYLLQGQRFDCGDKLSMVKATLAFALKRADMRAPLLECFQEHLNRQTNSLNRELEVEVSD